VTSRTSASAFRLAALTAALLAAACTRPEPEAAPPADLQIRVEIDGKPLSTIAAVDLAANPDIEDEHRQAWKLERLVPQLADARQLVVEQSDGQRVVLPLTDSIEAANIALVLNRKGEVVLAALDPDNPFPAYHGRGGNRGRAPGEERIRDLSWLRLRSRLSERGNREPGTR
jgi:hypothetical protein